MEDDNTARIDRWLLKALAAIAVIVVAGVIWSEARAHVALPTAAAPLGWSYGYECCSSTDCARAPAGDISTVEGGYRINSTGEVIPYNDRRIKRSRDEFYHRCAIGGNFKLDRSLCLYVPDQGF